MILWEEKEIKIIFFLTNTVNLNLIEQVMESGG